MSTSRDLDRDLSTNLDNFARVVDVLPGQFRHVDEAVYAAKVNECAEVDDGADNTAADLAL